MIHVACIKVVSRDRPCRVVAGWLGALAGACARAWSVKRGDGAVLIPQEAVIHVASVDVSSRDRPRWVDVGGERALAGACARAGNINVVMAPPGERTKP